LSSIYIISSIIYMNKKYIFYRYAVRGLQSIGPHLLVTSSKYPSGTLLYLSYVNIYKIRIVINRSIDLGGIRLVESGCNRSMDALSLFYCSGAALDPAQALQIELGAAIEGVETVLLN